jgi:hypothetical protein
MSADLAVLLDACVLLPMTKDQSLAVDRDWLTGFDVPARDSIY